MYSPSQVVKGLRRPDLLKKEVAKQMWKAISASTGSVFRRESIPLPERDWDNLLLLDACRFDLFQDCSSLPGTLTSRYSVASNTAEYVRRTFKGEQFPEIVCVTATPKYYKPNVEDSFHDIIHVWEDDWDKDNQTVLPGVMNDRVFEATKKYPNKRILAHYIPPHIPFIGPTGRKIPHQVVFGGNLIKQRADKLNLWNALEAGELNKTRVWKAYEENLELALSEIGKILPKLPGKTAVTSDHGNAFGEFGVYGHPPYRHIKSLIEVPWHIYQNGNRKEIIREETASKSENINNTVVQERLENLGYAE